ncbi:hypothetical protein [Jiangella asiatica]|uniref:Uncharacterized protein n=1 Tax=Jiangella asiatica TaxID=2530372 RepID=A0A4V2Z2G7_9ACTN|nr:hypothetical protein [Jiangella asiatica]TDE08788.1 hypothetical protein E1269_16625 [Jiangella asiatica]
MMIKTLNPSVCGVGDAYARSFRGVSATTGVRLLAPVNAPITGEVRPQAADVKQAHFVDGATRGVRVRSWRPPV